MNVFFSFLLTVSLLLTAGLRDLRTEMRFFGELIMHRDKRAD